MKALYIAINLSRHSPFSEYGHFALNCCIALFIVTIMQEPIPGSKRRQVEVETETNMDDINDGWMSGHGGRRENDRNTSTSKLTATSPVRTLQNRLVDESECSTSATFSSKQLHPVPLAALHLSTPGSSIAGGSALGTSGSSPSTSSLASTPLPVLSPRQNHLSSLSSHSNNIRLPRPSESFTRELSSVLQHSFLPSVMPTAEEYQIKEATRKFLEGLADKVSPGAKLLPFGSQANGMALRNSGEVYCSWVALSPALMYTINL